MKVTHESDYLVSVDFTYRIKGMSVGRMAERPVMADVGIVRSPAFQMRKKSAEPAGD